MTIQRSKNKWVVTLQGPDGGVVEYPFESFWSQEWDEINEAVAVSAAVQSWHESGKKVEFQPIAVTAK